MSYIYIYYNLIRSALPVLYCLNIKYKGDGLSSYFVRSITVPSRCDKGKPLLWHLFSKQQQHIRSKTRQVH